MGVNGGEWGRMRMKPGTYLQIENVLRMLQALQRQLARLVANLRDEHGQVLGRGRRRIRHVQLVDELLQQMAQYGCDAKVLVQKCDAPGNRHNGDLVALHNLNDLHGKCHGMIVALHGFAEYQKDGVVDPLLFDRRVGQCAISQVTQQTSVGGGGRQTNRNGKHTHTHTQKSLGYVNVYTQQ